MKKFKYYMAYGLAYVAHYGQKDKGGCDYFDHLLRVEANVHGTEERIVALLHDTIEDTWVTKKIINFVFGKDIAHSVDLLTRKKGVKAGYLPYIKGIRGNRVAQKVKEADLNDNMNVVRLPQEKWFEQETKRRLVKYGKALEILTT